MGALVNTDKEFLWFKNENMVIGGILGVLVLILITALFVVMLINYPESIGFLVVQALLLVATAILVSLLFLPRIPYVRIGGNAIKVRWTILGGWKVMRFEDIKVIRKKKNALYLWGKKFTGKGMELRLDFLHPDDYEKIMEYLRQYTSARVKEAK